MSVTHEVSSNLDENSEYDTDLETDTDGKILSNLDGIIFI